jgi:hypothetical protein
MMTMMLIRVSSAFLGRASDFMMSPTFILRYRNDEYKQENDVVLTPKVLNSAVVFNDDDDWHKYRLSSSQSTTTFQQKQQPTTVNHVDDPFGSQVDDLVSSTLQFHSISLSSSKLLYDMEYEDFQSFLYEQASLAAMEFSYRLRSFDDNESSSDLVSQRITMDKYDKGKERTWWRKLPMVVMLFHMNL